jgi:transposase
MEIITGVERRRRWSAEEKLRIVAETERPGVGIADIARRYEISRSLVWNWRSQARRGVLRPGPPAMFVPVQVVDGAAADERGKRAEPIAAARAASVPTEAGIEIRLSDGTTIRVGDDVSLVTLRRVVMALRG